MGEQRIDLGFTRVVVRWSADEATLVVEVSDDEIGGSHAVVSVPLEPGELARLRDALDEARRTILEG